MNSSKKPAQKKAKANDVQWTNEKNMRIFAPFSSISGQIFEENHSSQRRK